LDMAISGATAVFGSIPIWLTNTFSHFHDLSFALRLRGGCSWLRVSCSASTLTGSRPE